MKKFSFSGTPHAAGAAYGECLRNEILGFFQTEFGLEKAKGLSLARRCLPFLKRYAPSTARFLEGMAQGSLLTNEEALLLCFHEEHYHLTFQQRPHCTAIAAGSEALGRRKAFLVQNWDWPIYFYPWSSALDLKLGGSKPRILSYQYPGLFTAAGINEHGLALTWTGGGYFPVVAPRAGVPTYALISEVLLRKDLGDALRYLERTPRAGSFMFLLGDKSGETAVVEATPTLLHIERGKGISCRANLFEFPDIIKESRQERPNRRKHHSVVRLGAMRNTMKHWQPGRISERNLRAVLSEEPVLVQRNRVHATLDQIAADCKDRSLEIRRIGFAAQPRIYKFTF